MPELGPNLLAARSQRLVADAPARLPGRDLDRVLLQVPRAEPAAVRVTEMRVVTRILQVVEEVAGARIAVDVEHDVIGFEGGKAGQLRRLPLAQIGEDQAQILAGRIAADLYLVAEGLGLGRLLHAPATAVILPAVIEAADVLALDPADMKRHGAVCAPGVDHVGGSALTAVQGEILAHDAQRRRLAGCKFVGMEDGLPELPQIPAGQRTRPDLFHVLEGDLRSGGPVSVVSLLPGNGTVLHSLSPSKKSIWRPNGDTSTKASAHSAGITPVAGAHGCRLANARSSAAVCRGLG